MSKQSLSIKQKHRTFGIEEDLPEVGWYFYVYEGEKCTHDSLQDTKKACIEYAQEVFGLDSGLWGNV